MATGNATVKEVISGDTLVLVGASSKGGPPPEKRVSLASVIAPRVALKSLAHEVADEAYGWTAREFMRERLIGQAVQFKVEFAFNNREYACVKFQGENVACELLRKGLAKVKASQTPPIASDYDELIECQAVAEKASVNLFSNDTGALTIRQISWAVGDPSFVTDFAEEHKHKKLPGVVEFVRDGSAFRVSMRMTPAGVLPAKFVYASVVLSGVQCSNNQRDAEGKIIPDAIQTEARFFVEIRLLNRDVEVRIEGSDEYGNVMGTLYHPFGNMSLLLLKNGFGKTSGSVGLTEAPAQLRQAMKEAQQNRLRRWKDLTVSSAAENLAKIYSATVMEIVSGDCVLLLLGDGTTRRVYLASIRCPRMAGPNRSLSKEEDSVAFECKEFVRRKLIGKSVRVFLEYIREPMATLTGGPPPMPSDEKGNMHFVSLYILSPKELAIEQPLEGERKGTNLSELILQQGFAKTIPHRAEDDRAENYDKYCELEKEAMSAKRGMFCPPHLVKLVRLVDLMGPANTQRALSYTHELQRPAKLEGVVDHVFNAGRFKIRLPAQNICISFSLSGIRCPQTQRAAFTGVPVGGGKGPKEREGEPFGPESIFFSKSHILQRDVSIKVESTDRGGNFIGCLWYSNKQINLAAELLELGYAQTVDFSLSRTQAKDLLIEAERKAKAARLNIWSLPGALEAEAEADVIVQKETLTGVIVSHADSPQNFYVLDDSRNELQQVNAELDSMPDEPTMDERITEGGMPRKGELILGRFSDDKKWYRAMVESRDTSLKRVGVLYVDFGNRESLTLTNTRRCPPTLSLRVFPAQAKLCRLAGILPPPDMNAEACACFDSLVCDKAFHCEVDGIDEKKRLVVLTEEEDFVNKLPSINELMLRRGLCLLDRKSSCTHAERFRVAEEVARRGHVNVWRYGDVGPDDEDEDFPSMGAKLRPSRK